MDTEFVDSGGEELTILNRAFSADSQLQAAALRETQVQLARQCRESETGSGPQLPRVPQSRSYATGGRSGAARAAAGSTSGDLSNLSTTQTVVFRRHSRVLVTLLLYLGEQGVARHRFYCTSVLGYTYHLHQTVPRQEIGLKHDHPRLSWGKGGSFVLGRHIGAFWRNKEEKRQERRYQSSPFCLNQSKSIAIGKLERKASDVVDPYTRPLSSSATAPYLNRGVHIYVTGQLFLTSS